MNHKNMSKQESYKMMFVNLKKAMKYGYYYEAIFIEYAIIEDRLTSVLKSAGVKHINNTGRDISIKTKISRIKGRNEFHDEFLCKKLSATLLDSVEEWIDQRNVLVHHLASIPYDSMEIRRIAEKGDELLKDFKNKSASAIRYLKKNNNN